MPCGQKHFPSLRGLLFLYRGPSPGKVAALIKFLEQSPMSLCASETINRLRAELDGLKRFNDKLREENGRLLKYRIRYKNLCRKGRP